VDSTILAATVYDDGSGPALVVGGEFLHAGGTAMNRIAAWNGHAWKALGDGITGQWGYAVRALAVFDDGSGAALYAGGNFKTFGGAPADDIARWNGVSWSAVGSGTSGTVNALLVFDDGGGRRSTRPVSGMPEASPWAASPGGTGAHGPAWEAARASTPTRWRPSTTAPGRRSSPVAASRPRAASW
jgi:hypothetical protein